MAVFGGAMQMGIQGVKAAFISIVAVAGIGGSLIIGDIQETDILGTDPTNHVIIKNGTIPTATSDGILFIGAKDISTQSALSIYQETAVVADTDEAGFSHILPVTINGTTYYLMMTNAAP